MSAVGSPAWLARHELRLAWRDWRDMITAGGRRGLARTMVMFLAVAALFHMPVLAIVTSLQLGGSSTDRAALIATSVLLALFGSLLVSQAMETVTRSLYTRGDLDLVLSSPISLQRLFTIRLISNTVPIALLAMLLAMPLINVMALTDGPRWLAGFGVAAAFGAGASALAVVITIGLFRLLGPSRTRLIAQIVAAIIGATFAIGIQIIAILQFGTLASRSAFVSQGVKDALPGNDNALWIPARAVLGDMGALAAVIGATALLVLAVVTMFAPRLADISLSAATLMVSVGRRRRVVRRVIAASPSWALRRKEWALLRRDPWLVSQTLTQLLYLIPPALLLSQSLGGGFQTQTVVVMVLVTVGGQLAGSLAWLAISGEDAPELVATAPVDHRTVTRAKVEAVLTIIALVLSPLLIVFALASPWHAFIAAVGVYLAALSTIRIQLWFRSQARRSHFRRRHTSSRIATFAEALTSFSWAVAAGMAANLSPLAIISAAIALLILAGARSLSPRLAFA